MRKVEFDLNKLKKLCNVDEKSAIKNFESYEEYFLKLDEFIKESKYYLSAYSPDVILSDKEKISAFHEDIKKIRKILILLGITMPLNTLSELDSVDWYNNQAALTAWINKFRFEIDKTAQALICSQVSEEEASQHDIASLNKPRVLAVDDKPELLTTLVNMLNDRFKVMAVTSGKAALKLIEKHPPELFLLDIEMPQMNGYELATIIRNKEEFRYTPIIFLTGLNTRPSVISAVEKGGNDYVIKPVNKDILIKKMLHHLETAK